MTEDRKPDAIEAAVQAQTDLASLLATEKTINIGGKDVVVKKMRVKQIPPVIATISPFAHLLKSYKDQGEQFDMMQVVLYHNVEALQLVKILCDEEPEFVDELDIEELVVLVTAIVEVNLDFFVRRVLPLLSGEMARLASVMPKLTQEVGKSASST